MINNIGQFNKLYNLRINEIKNNNFHDSLLYTNGTNGAPCKIIST